MNIAKDTLNILNIKNLIVSSWNILVDLKSRLAITANTPLVFLRREKNFPFFIILSLNPDQIFLSTFLCGEGRSSPLNNLIPSRELATLILSQLLVSRFLVFFSPLIRNIRLLYQNSDWAFFTF